MKKLIRNKHWYTEIFDYTDDRDISWHSKEYGIERFWLDKGDEIIVKIARVYAIDEFAFTCQQAQKISAIIQSLIRDGCLKANHFVYETDGEIYLWYSFEPVGIQIGGQLALYDFEQWEQKWHDYLEKAGFPYKYEDDPDFSY